MFSFKIFLLFRVRVAGEKVTEKEGILARERQFQQLVLVLAKCGKISDVQAIGSAVTVVLKKAVLVVMKNCDSYHEKVVLAVRKSCDSYHEKAVLAVKKSCGSYHEKAVSVVRKNYLLWAEANDVRWVISDCWRGHLVFTLCIWLKNGKISLKGIMLFWV